jgi:hypothetical protein
MHGKGAARRTSALARDPRGGSEKLTRAHFSELKMIEDDGDDGLLVRRPDPKATEQFRCARCLQDRSSGQFLPGAANAEDNEKICLPCRSQWMPSGVVYNGHPLPIIPGSSPTRFLGIHGDMRGECSMQISLFSKSRHSSSTFFGRKNSPRATASAWYR